MQSTTRFSSPVRAAAVETLERRQLFATIPLGEIGLGHRAEYATPHGTNSYTFSLDKPATLDIALSNGTASIKRNGVVMSSGEKFSRPLASGNYSIEVNAKGGSSLLVKSSDFSPPTRLQGEALSATSGRLNWDDNTDGEAQYRVDRWTRLGWRRGPRTVADATAVIVPNLVPGYQTTYRVNAVTADGISLRSANIVALNTPVVNEAGWYKVKITEGMQEAFAGWIKENRPGRGEADTLKILPQYQLNGSTTQSDWLYAGSWKDAVYTAIGSYKIENGQYSVDSAKVRVTFDGGGKSTGDTQYHNFPTGGDFKVGTGAELAEDESIENFKLNASAIIKYIALEDSYRQIDRDYDDFYWKVETTKAAFDLSARRLSNAVEYEEEEEQSGLGAVVRFNNDNDSSGTVPDWSVLTGSNEDDLIPISLELGAELDSYPVSLFLSAPGDNVRVWKSATKGGDENLLMGAWGAGPGSEGREVKSLWFRGEDVPDTLWVEGIAPSASPRDIKLTLQVEFSETAEPMTDEMDLSVVGVQISPTRWLKDNPPGGQYSPLTPESDGTPVVYGGSERSTSDEVIFSGAPTLVSVEERVWTWVVSDTDLFSEAPPIEDDMSNLYHAGWTSAEPGSHWVRSETTVRDEDVFGVYRFEVGIRTDDVIVVGWINPAGVQLQLANVDPRVTAMFGPNGTVASATQAASILADLSENYRSTALYPNLMRSEDGRYLLDWLFKYGSNTDPASVIPGGDFRTAFGTSIDNNEVDAFRDTHTNYKLFNRLQIRYRLHDGEFSGDPFLIHAETSIGSTVSPLGPIAGFGGTFPGQTGPSDSSRTGTYVGGNRVASINDGSPDSAGIRTMNTLMNIAGFGNHFWENIGSKITFRATGGTGAEIELQNYPTYYQFNNGVLADTTPQASAPMFHFYTNAYPFGTAPSARAGGVLPGGRSGDATSAPDATARVPDYTVP